MLQSPAIVQGFVFLKIMIACILTFLCISFGYSLFEKLRDKKNYLLFLTNHLKKENYSLLFWWTLVIINTITTTIIICSLLQILLNISVIPILYAFQASAITILILLIGQRIAGDYQGAANLGIYLLVTIAGWYLQTH